MPTYRGERRADGYCHVTADGQPLVPRFDLRKHSPTGFEWGYFGSGPAQLALALTAHYLRATSGLPGDQADESALQLYQKIKERIVGRLPHDGWTLNDEFISAAISAIAGTVEA